MAVEMATVQAKFDERDFTITGRSANLKEVPSADWTLLQYLNFLGQNGWKAARGRFDGWTVIIDLERQAGAPDNISKHLMLMVYEKPDPEEQLSTTAELHSTLFNQLQGVRVKEGWEILAGPKHLSSIKGVWTLSLWAKHSPGK